ncbi:MAG: hypothetical protein ACOYVK_18480 [Bacillota bacterium]
MERALSVGNKILVEKLAEEIIVKCNEIKADLDEKRKSFQDIGFHHINEVKFLYKPIMKKNPYEGTYLEEFSQRRTEELKAAKALDVHNRFWQNHEISRGNIFGSVPMELISKDAVRKLLSFGWEEVDVAVLEVKENPCSIREFVEYCEMTFQHFLIVKEKSTGAEIILHYKI